MLAAPSPGPAVSTKPWRLPGRRAVPRNGAYSDHTNADRVPTETTVSMVAEPCRRFIHAAARKARPAQMTTDAAKAGDAHCQ